MVAGGNRARLHDLALQPDHGAQRVGLAALRRDAVQGRTGAHQVEVIVGRQKDARGIGQAGAVLRQTGADGDETGQLLAIHGVATLVGARQVAHDVAHLDAVKKVGIQQPGVDFLRRQAHARHARVHLHDGVQGFPQCLGVCAPAGHLRLAVEHWRQAMGREFAFRIDGWTVQHEDGRVRRHVRAQADALFQMRHKKVPATLFIQGRAHLRGAQAIGVGFDDGRAGGRVRLVAQQAVIGAHGIEVHRQDGAATFLGRHAGRHLRLPRIAVCRRAARRCSG